MKLTELLTSPWAIVPESLREIQQIYATHCKGEKIDVAAVEARLGRPLANDQQQYAVREGGIAVLPIEGILAPKANLFTQVSGGASTQMLTRQVESAMADSRVKGLVLDIDSPGGSVFGIPELAAVVSQAAQYKPVVTVSGATIASAAYWFGSAANGVYLTGSMVQAGSIGILARMSLSKADDASIEFARGKYKRPSLNGGKPDEAFMSYYEAQLDHMYSVFVDAVAQHRGVTSAQVLDRMADGRTFIGQQAIDAGLADGFSTVDAMVEAMATNPKDYAARRRAVFALGTPGKTSALAPAGVQAQQGNPQPEPVLLDTPKGSSMDRATLEQQHPALFAQLQTEFSASGATQERERIQAVLATAMPGHEPLVQGLAFDGKTTPGEAAQAVLAAERQARSAHAAAMASDAPAPVPQAPAANVAGDAHAADAAKPDTPEARDAATRAYAAANNCDYLTALKSLGFR